MKLLQVGDECYVRYKKAILKCVWSETIAIFMNNHRRDARLIYPYPIIKQLAK
jgi:hypothetical protein